MILQSTRIKSKGGVHYLTRHLLDKVDDNERIDILLGDRNALEDAHSLARIKGCTYSVRHISVSPQNEMAPEQLRDFLFSIDDALAIGADRPRLLVRHTKNGRSHFHIAIGEVDPKTLRVLECRNDFAKLEAVARRYEMLNDEFVQASRRERRQKRFVGFSDVARKRAERQAPDFDRTKLKAAYSAGEGSFLAEMELQGLQLADGKKGLILVACDGAFVAAANRAVGVSRQEFSIALKEMQNDSTAACGSRKAHDRRAKHRETLSASVITRSASRHGSDCSTQRTAIADFGSATSADTSTEIPHRKGRSAIEPLNVFGGEEKVLLKLLERLDLDAMRRLAQELAEWLALILQPQSDRLIEQIRIVGRARSAASPVNPHTAAPGANVYQRSFKP